MTAPRRFALLSAVALCATLLAGCTGSASGPEVTLDGPEPGQIGTVRCVGPAVAGTTPLPADVTQMSTSGLEFCVVGHGDASAPGESGTLVTAVEFTVQNPSTRTVALPADVPTLQAAPYGPAGVVAPEAPVLPEELGPRSSITVRVRYDYTADQRTGAQLHWADLVVELAD